MPVKTIIFLQQQLVPDFIKIDRKLVMDCDQHDGRMNVIKGVVSMARSMKVSVIAEGIQRDEELAAVRRLRVKYGQGYKLGWPGEYASLRPVRLQGNPAAGY